MSRFPLALLMLSLAALPLAAAQAPAPDVVVTLRPGDARVADGEAAIVTATAENVSLTLHLTKPWTIVEVRHDGYFDVERARQVVPMLWVPHEDFPLFSDIPRAVHDIDGVPRYGLYNLTFDGATAILHLGLPGPREGGPNASFDALLSLTRDVTPPRITPGPVTDIEWRGFYQEARTDELTLMDLAVCCDARGEPIHNPTQVYHVLHKFPIQGLDAEKRYDLDLSAEDWAQNVAHAPAYAVTTPARPIVPKPLVTPLTPAPDARVAEGDRVVISARIESPNVSLAENGIRFFLDKKPVNENLRYENGTFTYVARLDAGIHSANVEAVNAEGGMGYASWTFRVGGDVPALPAGAIVALALLGLLARRR